MICYECGHQIKQDFARFCDHCGSSLEIKPKNVTTSNVVTTNLHDEIEQATNLFILWNGSIAGTFIFYIIHSVTDNYFYLFLLTLFMLLLSWMLLLMKLHDLVMRKNQSKKAFIFANFSLPLIGTFYSFIKLTQK